MPEMVVTCRWSLIVVVVRWSLTMVVVRWSLTVVVVVRCSAKDACWVVVNGGMPKVDGGGWRLKVVIIVWW
ncbi:hypothetical protein Hanom_Chr01g00090111 [Helianthus anomalus]